MSDLNKNNVERLVNAVLALGAILAIIFISPYLLSAEDSKSETASTPSIIVDTPMPGHRGVAMQEMQAGLEKILEANRQFGEFAGMQTTVKVPTDSNVWERVDEFVSLNTHDAETVANHEQIVSRIVAIAQADNNSDLELVYPGFMTTITIPGLPLYPTPFGTVVPDGLEAPEGSVMIEPSYDDPFGPLATNNLPSTNPQLGTSQPEKSATSGETAQKGGYDPFSDPNNWTLVPAVSPPVWSDEASTPQPAVEPGN